ADPDACPAAIESDDRVPDLLATPVPGQASRVRAVFGQVGAPGGTLENHGHRLPVPTEPILLSLASALRSQPRIRPLEMIARPVEIRAAGIGRLNLAGCAVGDVLLKDRDTVLDRSRAGLPAVDLEGHAAREFGQVAADRVDPGSQGSGR